MNIDVSLEEPILKKRQDLVPPPPKKRQKDKSHTVVDPQEELEKLQ